MTLDEDTSALGRDKEKEIQKILNSLSEGSMTTVVAHRLLTIKNADHPIELWEGRSWKKGLTSSCTQMKDHILS
jgi:ABC-type transport system involved in Fe-S cluster assembly fused permease/ATPase subunit